MPIHYVNDEHVVTITTPVRDGHIHLPPATDVTATDVALTDLSAADSSAADPPTRAPAAVQAASVATVPAVPSTLASTGPEGLGRRHRRVHRDLYVFGQQHDERIPTGPDLDLPTDPMLDLTKIGVPR